MIKKRILQVGMTNNIGGLETYLLQQFNNLNKDRLIYDFVNVTISDHIVFENELKKWKYNIQYLFSKEKSDKALFAMDYIIC